jgi:hypothetical protein
MVASKVALPDFLPGFPSLYRPDSWFPPAAPAGEDILCVNRLNLLDPHELSGPLNSGHVDQFSSLEIQ